MRPESFSRPFRVAAPISPRWIWSRRGFENVAIPPIAPHRDIHSQYYDLPINLRFRYRLPSPQRRYTLDRSGGPTVRFTRPKGRPADNKKYPNFHRNRPHRIHLLSQRIYLHIDNFYLSLLRNDPRRPFLPLSLYFGHSLGFKRS